MVSIIHTASLALALIAQTLTAPADCRVRHTFEDGSGLASCADGREVRFDPDGGRSGPAGWYQVEAAR